MWDKISVNDNCYSECYKLTINLGFTGFQFLYNVALCIVSYIKTAFEVFILNEIIFPQLGKVDAYIQFIICYQENTILKVVPNILSILILFEEYM